MCHFWHMSSLRVKAMIKGKLFFSITRQILCFAYWHFLHKFFTALSCHYYELWRERNKKCLPWNLKNACRTEAQAEEKTQQNFSIELVLLRASRVFQLISSFKRLIVSLKIGRTSWKIKTTGRMKAIKTAKLYGNSEKKYFRNYARS